MVRGLIKIDLLQITTEFVDRQKLEEDRGRRRAARCTQNAGRQFLTRIVTVPIRFGYAWTAVG